MRVYLISGPAEVLVPLIEKWTWAHGNGEMVFAGKVLVDCPVRLWTREANVFLK